MPRRFIRSGSERVLSPSLNRLASTVREPRLAEQMGTINTASPGREWRLLLFHLIRGLRPAMCVEMGTALGMSAAFQAAALALNGRGRLVTAEGAPTFADAARQHLDALGLSAVKLVVGRFQDTLDGILREHRPVDYAFVDGHHDGDATVAYFKQFLPHLSDGALLVFDDILYYPSMQRAWRMMAAHPHVRVAVDLGRFGLCVVGAPGPSEWYDLRLAFLTPEVLRRYGQDATIRPRWRDRP